MRALSEWHGRCLVGMVAETETNQSGSRFTARDESVIALPVRSLLLQGMVVAAVGAVLWWRQPEAVGPACACGLIAMAANLASSVLALRRRHGARDVMVALLLAEIVKFVVVVLGFALVFWWYADRLAGVGALWLIGTFALTLVAQWLVPAMAPGSQLRH